MFHKHILSIIIIILSIIKRKFGWCRVATAYRYHSTQIIIKQLHIVGALKTKL